MLSNREWDAPFHNKVGHKFVDSFFAISNWISFLPTKTDPLMSELHTQRVFVRVFPKAGTNRVCTFMARPTILQTKSFSSNFVIPIWV